MVQFFLMVFNGISIAIAWLSKFTSWSNSASLLSNIRFIGRKALYIALIALIIAYIVILIAFFYFMTDVIITSYNTISSIIDKIQNVGTTNSGSPVMQGFYYFLNVSGIGAGLTIVFPFFASALSFRLLKALYTLILETHWKLLNFYRVTVDGITAS